MSERVVQTSVPRTNLRAEPHPAGDIVAVLVEGTEIEILESTGRYVKVRACNPEQGTITGFVATHMVDLPSSLNVQDGKEVAALLPMTPRRLVLVIVGVLLLVIGVPLSMASLSVQHLWSNTPNKQVVSYLADNGLYEVESKDRKSVV